MEELYPSENIRNFAIIAHIDHGKSTLADRLLEMTGTVPRRQMREQFLDSMDLERERGITIKLKAVRMNYNPPTLPLRGASGYQLNMIDTPGHVDFGYEVSRSLAACEGVVLVVDATQGIQAQTVANVYKALEQNLKILTFINKVDLPAAQREKVAREVKETFGFDDADIIFGSAKTGEGVEKLLENITSKIPPPTSSALADGHVLRALIFDSVYDEHLGALAFIRVFDGEIRTFDNLRFLSNDFRANCIELGIFSPQREKIEKLDSGEVGYVATGLKDLRKVRTGDTITKITNNPSAPLRAGKLQMTNDTVPLPGYQEPKPMVYLGFYPMDGGDFLKLRTALEKVYLTDSSITFEPESSKALGNGFRCGFLGLLHADIIHERLEREYALDLITTLPSVPYLLEKETGEKILINSVSHLPDLYGQQKIGEPWLKVSVFVPSSYLGSVLSLCQEYRGILIGTEYLGNSVKISYQMPLSEMLYDFYDKLKSVTSGYASLDYEFLEFRPAEICRLDILVAGEPVDPLSQIVIKEKAQVLGKSIVTKLKDLLPRQQFAVALQAAIGGPSTSSGHGKIIAREDIPALRKNVLAKMSGGDRTRKDKLLEKQKRGKNRLKRFGKIDIPKEVFTKLLKVN